MISAFDLLLVPVAYVYVFGIIFLASRWKKSGRVDGALARKMVHLGIGILVIFAPLIFSSNIIPTIIGITFILITFLTSPISPVINWRLSAFRDGHGLGTVYYSVSLTALLYLFFDHGWIIQVGFLPLVFGDAFANIVGMRYGKLKWPGTEKSLEGSLAGGVATLIIVLLSLCLYLVLGRYPGTFISVILLSLITSIMMPIVELFSPYGLDNLSIPFVCTSLAVMLHQTFFSLSCVTILCL